jgi:hypothetical protein
MTDTLPPIQKKLNETESIDYCMPFIQANNLKFIKTAILENRITCSESLSNFVGPLDYTLARDIMTIKNSQTLDVDEEIKYFINYSFPCEEDSDILGVASSLEEAFMVKENLETLRKECIEKCRRECREKCGRKCRNKCQKIEYDNNHHALKLFMNKGCSYGIKSVFINFMKYKNGIVTFFDGFYNF